jgi:hypothetical protein
MKKKIIKKPFDLEAYKNGAKIQTRDGHEVRIVCTNAENPRFPIIALAKLYNEEEVVVHYTLEGKALLADVIHQNDLVIVEEVKGPEYWSEDTSNTISGFEISSCARITEIDGAPNREAFYNVFATKKQAKSAKAMARISQIMANDKRFGGVVTDEEWEDDNIVKYVIERAKNGVLLNSTLYYYRFLTFHTAEQRGLFLEENEDLIRDYLML